MDNKKIALITLAGLGVYFITYPFRHLDEFDGDDFQMSFTFFLGIACLLFVSSLFVRWEENETVNPKLEKRFRLSAFVALAVGLIAPIVINEGY